MRIVASLLPVKITAVSLLPALFRLETLLRCPRFDQGPIHGEVLVRHVAPGPLHHPLEEAPRRLLVEQSIPVLREHGGIPHPLVHAHPHEPPEQEVVVQFASSAAHCGSSRGSATVAPAATAPAQRRPSGCAL